MLNDMSLAGQWQRAPGARIEGSGPLDSGKVQAPCIVRISDGGYRLFYTAVGPGRPFAECQGYVMSAVSDDGLTFRKEPGIRVAPVPDVPYISRRVLAPSVCRCSDGSYRMYFEARGTADRPTVICSAVSSDMLNWRIEPGIRIERPGGVGAPRYADLDDGRGRLYFTEAVFDGEISLGNRSAQHIKSAVTSDGIHFNVESGVRMHDRQGAYDDVGITAAEVVKPAGYETWTMVYSAWQDVPPGTYVPPHPSLSGRESAGAETLDFAAASIASDISGYRSRIFAATSDDGLNFLKGSCILEGAGYGADGLDAIHAEDMSLTQLDDGSYRMYYAACDTHGNWRIASARSRRNDEGT